VIVVAAGLVAVVSVRLLHHSPDAVTASVKILNNEDRFSTASGASDALAEIGSKLRAVDCDADRNSRCVRIRRATAWADVSAVLIVQCTPPLVYEARTGLRRYLTGRGELPPAPRCGARRGQSSE
jgi:hypothetical protein